MTGTHVRLFIEPDYLTTVGTDRPLTIELTLTEGGRPGRTRSSFTPFIPPGIANLLQIAPTDASADPVGFACTTLFTVRNLPALDRSVRFALFQDTIPIGDYIIQPNQTHFETYFVDTRKSAGSTAPFSSAVEIRLYDTPQFDVFSDYTGSVQLKPVAAKLETVKEIATFVDRIQHLTPGDFNTATVLLCTAVEAMRLLPAAGDRRQLVAAPLQLLIQIAEPGPPERVYMFNKLLAELVGLCDIDYLIVPLAASTIEHIAQVLRASQVRVE